MIFNKHGDKSGKIESDKLTVIHYHGFKFWTRKYKLFELIYLMGAFILIQ